MVGSVPSPVLDLKPVGELSWSQDNGDRSSATAGRGGMKTGLQEVRAVLTVRPGGPDSHSLVKGFKCQAEGLELCPRVAEKSWEGISGVSCVVRSPL
jgi:hypothetical protein